MYPELAALCGPVVPDYQGLFLRGFGSYDADRAAGPLGQVQEDPMRPITGIGGANYGAYVGSGSGAIYHPNQISGSYPSGAHMATLSWNFSLDSSRLGPNYSGAETRPVNTAVRYLMRAKD